MSQALKTNKTKLWLAASAVTLIVVAGFAATSEAFGGKSRHEGRGGFMGSFGPAFLQGLDQNSDGTVSEQEVEAKFLTLFAEADANNDGEVSMDEFTKLRETYIQQKGQKGRSERREARAERRMERMFERADDNGDGAVSEQEFRDGFADRSERIAERATQMYERLNERFTQLDSNNDGQISKEEFQAAPFGLHSDGRHSGRGG